MRHTTIGLLVLVLQACGNRNTEHSFEQDQARWMQERVARLKSESGWLNLAGLYWLKEGENTVGSDSSNQVIFPAKAPARIGKYIIDGDSVRFEPAPGAGIMQGEVPAEEMGINTDRSDRPTVLKSGSLAWFIIERDERFAIRLRDYEHPALKEFKGIEYFPADRKWIIRAEFKAFGEPREMLIPTMAGGSEKYVCPGVLMFEVGGIDQELYPVESGDGLFIIFADETSGSETYGGGRFLYTEDPGEDGTVQLNFNRAYNPPCAFTPHATCPLPPKENVLPVRIEAGEKFGGH